jgi:hypothetical protein
MLLLLLLLLLQATKLRPQTLVVLLVLGMLETLFAEFLFCSLRCRNVNDVRVQKITHAFLHRAKVRVGYANVLRSNYL